MSIINGKDVRIVSSHSAWILGFLTRAEYHTTRFWELVRLSRGINPPYLVYVDGRYRGVTYYEEKMYDMVARLKI